MIDDRCFNCQLIDTHTHLDADDFDPDREDVIKRAQAAGVAAFITIGAGSGMQSAENAVALSERYNFIWCSVGIHPNDAGKPYDLKRIKELASHPRVLAIGESGLDYFRDWATKEEQFRAFEAQIGIALDLNKPIIIHSREAGQDCLDLLIKMDAKRTGGVFHCYSEDAAFATRLAQINFMVSVPGNITFKKSEQFREAISAIPLSQIMLETDAPYLAPEPNRGKRCESAMMVETAKMVARVKGLSLEEVAAATTANAKRFFKIPLPSL